MVRTDYWLSSRSRSHTDSYSCRKNLYSFAHSDSSKSSLHPAFVRDQEESSLGLWDSFEICGGAAQPDHPACSHTDSYFCRKNSYSFANSDSSKNSLQEESSLGLWGFEAFLFSCGLSNTSNDDDQQPFFHPFAKGEDDGE